MKEFIIYSKRLANELAKNGFKVLRADINYKYPNLYVFVFEDTPELREAVEKFRNK